MLGCVSNELGKFSLLFLEWQSPSLPYAWSHWSCLCLCVAVERRKSQAPLWEFLNLIWNWVCRLSGGKEHLAWSVQKQNDCPVLNSRSFFFFFPLGSMGSLLCPSGRTKEGTVCTPLRVVIHRGSLLLRGFFLGLGEQQASLGDTIVQKVHLTLGRR